MSICIELNHSEMIFWNFTADLKQKFKKKEKRPLQLNSKLIIHFCANVVLPNETLNKYFMHIIDSFVYKCLQITIKIIDSHDLF